MACNCNTACRDKLIAAKNKAQAKAACLGGENYATEVKVVTRTWTGEKGLGTYVDTVVTLDPRPKVGEVPPRYRAEEGGKSARGRRLVQSVNLTYAKDTLTDTALTAGQERFFLLNDDFYRIDSEPIESKWGWKFEVARTQPLPPIVEA